MSVASSLLTKDIRLVSALGWYCLLVVGQFDTDAIINLVLIEEAKMKGTPTQKQGNIPRPVKTKGGLRLDISGDGVSPLPEKRIALPKFSPSQKHWLSCQSHYLVFLTGVGWPVGLADGWRLTAPFLLPVSLSNPIEKIEACAIIVFNTSPVASAAGPRLPTGSLYL